MTNAACLWRSRPSARQTTTTEVVQMLKKQAAMQLLIDHGTEHVESRLAESLKEQAVCINPLHPILESRAGGADRPIVTILESC